MTKIQRVWGFAADLFFVSAGSPARRGYGAPELPKGRWLFHERCDDKTKGSTPLLSPVSCIKPQGDHGQGIQAAPGTSPSSHARAERGLHRGDDTVTFRGPLATQTGRGLAGDSWLHESTRARSH
jgi:hypothetical protein